VNYSLLELVHSALECELCGFRVNNNHNLMLVLIINKHCTNYEVMTELTFLPLAAPGSLVISFPFPGKTDLVPIE